MSEISERVERITDSQCDVELDPTNQVGKHYTSNSKDFSMGYPTGKAH